MDKSVCVCVKGPTGKRVLDNESDVAFNPLLLDCKVWCNAQVQLSQHPHKKRPIALPPAFKSKTGILSTWQDQAWHWIPHWDTEQGLLSRLQLLLSHSFPPLTLEEWTLPSLTKLQEHKKKKNFLYLEKEERTHWRRLSLCWFKCSFRYSICQS